MPTDTPSPSAPKGYEVRNHVLLSEDGWLFLYSGAQDQFAFLTGERTPDEQSITAFWSNLQARAQFCADRSLPYLHIVFPSKPVVMTGRLPLGLRDRVRSLYLTSYLSEAAPGASQRVLYPLDQLRALDSTDLPFLRTDTHLSHLGCAVVAEAALATLGEGYNLAAHFHRGTGSYQGDLSTMLEREDPQPQVTLAEYGFRPAVADNLRFLNSNSHNVLLMQNPHSATSKRLAVVGDSYFRQCLRFFAPVFRDIMYLRGPGLHADTLDRFAPDAVMTGNAERYLAKVPRDAEVPDILAVLAATPDYRPDETFTSALAAQLRSEAFESRPGQDGLAVLRRDLADLQAQLDEMRQLQQRKDEEQLQAQVDLRDLLRRKEDQLEDLRARKDARIKKQSQQIERQQKRLAEAERLLAEFQQSTTWRITTPLRRLAKRLRRFR